MTHKSQITGKYIVGREYFHNPIRMQYTIGDDLLNQVGGGAAGAIGNIIGLPFQMIGNAMQQHQNDINTQRQVAASKELASYNMDLQKQMWDETNYEAQVNHLKNAGLNPALLYAKGRAGGTTGSPSGNVGMGVNTPIHETAQNNLAIEQAQANIELTKAQANAINTKLPTEVDQMKADIESINQGVNNAKAQETLTQVQTQTARLQNSITGETIDDQIATIRSVAGLNENMMQREARNNNIDQQTMQTRIKTLNGIYLQTYLQNNLIKAQTENTNATTDLTKQKIKESVNKIMQDWEQIGLNTESNQTNRTHVQLQDMLNDIPMSAQTAAGLTKLIGILKQK